MAVFERLVIVKQLDFTYIPGDQEPKQAVACDRLTIRIDACASGFCFPSKPPVVSRKALKSEAVPVATLPKGSVGYGDISITDVMWTSELCGVGTCPAVGHADLPSICEVVG